MELATIIQIGLLILVGYMCLYALIDRICKCAENCAAFKSFGPTAIANPEMFKEAMTKVKKK
jgi:hypothetical protein